MYVGVLCFQVQRKVGVRQMDRWRTLAITQDVGVYVQKGSEQPTCTCGSSFFLGKVTDVGVLCCFALLFV